MEVSPKISVIMAAHNSGKYIEESILSILNQTFRDFELIVVNDCSTDNTPEIIQKYAKDPRVIIINNESNLQQALSRNKGLKIAKGGYIAILDSDDISLPDRLRVQYNYLKNNSDIALVGCGAEIINENGKIIGRKYPSVDFKKIKFELITKNPIIHSSILYRKNAADSVSGYNNNYVHSEDYKFYSDLVSEGHNIVNLPDILIKYRHSQDAVSISKQTRKIQLEHAFAVSFENIKKYIQLSERSARIFIDSVQKTNLSIRSVLGSIYIYKKLAAAFLSKEALNSKEKEDIWDIYNRHKKELFRAYLKQKFPGIINKVKLAFR